MTDKTDYEKRLEDIAQKCARWLGLLLETRALREGLSVDNLRKRVLEITEVERERTG